jgi:3-oxoacyl-[acyl-carrier-protein] synthase-3
MTNADLEKLVDTSDQWITERTGIKERRIASQAEASSDLALRAAQQALDMAGVTPSALDMVIVGTITPDMPLPACAAVLHNKLGAKGIPAFDISAACAGFIYALSIADQFIKTGLCSRVLVVGVEMLSKVINWQDRNTCVLFGDGAGAVVLVPAEEDSGRVLSSKLYTDSSLVDSLRIPAGGSREPLTIEGLTAQRNKVHMVGSDIFRIAVRNLTSASRSALTEAQLSPEAVDWVVPHQANLRIINQVAQRLGIPYERFILNIDRYGNTSSASIPIALDQGVRDGRVKPGDTVLMCALGAGVSWASALVRM